MRLPKSVVELLDALVLHEKNQIAAQGLAGTSNRTAVLESLITAKAKQVGLVPADDVGQVAPQPLSPVPKKQGSRKKPRSVWSRIRKPEV